MSDVVVYISPSFVESAAVSTNGDMHFRLKKLMQVETDQCQYICIQMHVYNIINIKP